MASCEGVVRCVVWCVVAGTQCLQLCKSRCWAAEGDFSFLQFQDVWLVTRLRHEPLFFYEGTMSCPTPSQYCCELQDWGHVSDKVAKLSAAT